MKVWALTDGPVREGKYLVVRRDGTTPDWPHFVLAGVDPASPTALRAYAVEARRLGMAEDFCSSVEELAAQYSALAVQRASDAAVLGVKGADPDKGPHRKDCPEVIAMMRGKFDVAALAARIEELEAALKELLEDSYPIGTGENAEVRERAIAALRGRHD